MGLVSMHVHRITVSKLVRRGEKRSIKETKESKFLFNLLVTFTSLVIFGVVFSFFTGCQRNFKHGKLILRSRRKERTLSQICLRLSR